MKKIFIVLLAVAMMALFAIAANAAVGTVVTATKVDTEPNMKAIDASWGSPAIILNGGSPNTLLYDFYSQKSVSVSHVLNDRELQVGIESGVKAENHDVELYYLWDSKNLYFGLKTKDDLLFGDATPYFGDGVQMWLQPMDAAVAAGVLNTGVNAHATPANSGTYDFSVTLDMDDWSTNAKSTPNYANAASECECYINPENADELQVIIKIPLINLGLNAKNGLDGVELATALLRISSTGAVERQTYNGWLEWGKYFTDSDNTSMNTIVFSDAAGSETTPPPATETNPPVDEPNLDGVSSWAKEEVEKGISEGLVPTELQQNYTTPVTRGQVAQMFINLLEKATGKTVDEIMAEKGVAINENAFTDTTDKAVLAANALGIINGTGNGKFSPNGTLKRAQIAAIINRVAKVMGVGTEGYTHEFTDITDNYKWANSELGWPVYAGIINGVGGGRFNPGGDLTTEQAILITYRGLTALKK